MSTQNSPCIPFDIGYNPRWVHDCPRHLPLHDDGRCWLIQDREHIPTDLPLPCARPGKSGPQLPPLRVPRPANTLSEWLVGMRWGVEHHRAHQEFWQPHITANEHPLNPRIFGDLDTDEDWARG